MDFPGWSAFGDSLMDQNGSGQLRRRLQMAGHMFAVRDYGVGGQSTTNGLVRFASNVLAKPDGIISIQMGVNDLWGAGTPAGANTVIANLQTMYTAAKAAGKTVVAISLYPCKGSVSYDANVQANIDLINAWIADSVTGATDVDFRIDAYTVLEDPANPDTLLPAYDDGGHLHLSQDGYIAVADAIIAQVFV
jgi:lysophospholipase L1-like esterase